MNLGEEYLNVMTFKTLVIPRCKKIFYFVFCFLHCGLTSDKELNITKRLSMSPYIGVNYKL